MAVSSVNSFQIVDRIPSDNRWGCTIVIVVTLGLLQPTQVVSLTRSNTRLQYFDDISCLNVRIDPNPRRGCGCCTSIAAAVLPPGQHLGPVETRIDVKDLAGEHRGETLVPIGGVDTGVVGIDLHLGKNRSLFLVVLLLLVLQGLIDADEAENGPAQINPDAAAFLYFVSRGAAGFCLVRF